MHRMKEFMEQLEEAAKCEFDKGVHCINTTEMGKVIDMIKDCAMTMYYYTCYEEMKEEEEWEGESRKYYDRYRYANGRFAPKGRGRKMGFEEPPYWHMMPEWGTEMLDGRDMDMSIGRMYTGDKGSRYGYSHDEYMKEKKMHPGQDEASKRKRSEKLDERLNDLEGMAKEMVEGMSPEEKQAWKVKLNKLINM